MAGITTAIQGNIFSRTNILISLVTFTYLRYLILTPLSLNLYARFFHLMPFIFLSVLTFKNYKSQTLNLKRKPVAIFTFIVFLYALTVILAQTLFFGFPLFSKVIPDFASTHISLFLIPLLIINFTSRQLSYVLDKLTLITCIVGTAYFFVFYFVIYHIGVPTYELLTMFMGKEASALYGDTYTLMKNNVRQIGHLLIHDRSGAGLCASLSYQFYLFSENIKNGNKPSKVFFFLIFITFTGVIFSTSLTSTLASWFVLSLICFIQFKNKIYAFLLSVISIIYGVGVSRLFKGIWDRVHIVFFKSSSYYRKAFMPGSFGCTPEYIIWRPNTPDAIANIGKPCYFNEIFALFPIVKFGIVPMLPWFIIFMSPALKVFKFWKLRSEQIASLALVISFWICGLHFSGAEFWGNNILFFISWVLLFAHDEETTDSREKRPFYWKMIRSKSNSRPKSAPL